LSEAHDWVRACLIRIQTRVNLVGVGFTNRQTEAAEGVKREFNLILKPNREFKASTTVQKQNGKSVRLRVSGPNQLPPDGRRP
jgi:hypothetical protein